MRHSRTSTVASLGLAQTLAWASGYYLPAILATSMARDLGVSTPTVFAGFSVALVVSALLGPAAGKAIDRHGGRPVRTANSLVFAAGLVALAFAQGPVGLFAAWMLLGVAMAAGLYEAAFAALVHLYGKDARRAVTGIALFVGFASTVGWPLSTWLKLEWGWRAACLAWAGLHLLLALPLNWRLPSSPAVPVAPQLVSTALEVPETVPSASPPHHNSARKAALLASVFAVTWFISTAMVRAPATAAAGPWRTGGDRAGLCRAGRPCAGYRTITPKGDGTSTARAHRSGRPASPANYGEAAAG